MRTDCPKTLDSKDSEKLLDALLSDTHTAIKKRKAVRNHCMALLMLEAGLRVGELVALRLGDLFFNREPVRTILIKPNMTKNKVEHTIPVSPRLAETLSIYFIIVTTEYGSDIDFTQFAFRTSQGTLTTRQVERIICAAGWKALNRPVHPHVLRHTFASRLMRITSSSTLQQLLGHKYLTSTQIYCHPNEDDKRQAIEEASQAPEANQSAEPPQQDQPQSASPLRPGPQPASQSGPESPSHW